MGPRGAKIRRGRGDRSGGDAEYHEQEGVPDMTQHYKSTL